jgi:hypothetical protein
MKPPAYRWLCHSCKTANDPGTEKCWSCGFEAYARGRDIPSPQQSTARTSPERALPLSVWDNPAMYFPEVIPAVIVVIASPVWFFRLLAAQQWLAAGTLATGLVLGGFLVTHALRINATYLVYAAILLVLVAAAIVHTLSS